MPRCEIHEYVLDRQGRGLPHSRVEVRARGTQTLSTVYAAETGAATVSNPLTPLADGRLEGWVDLGAYDLYVTATGFTPFLQRFEASQGDGGVLASLVTSLPSSPTNGQEIMYLADDTNGVVWHLRYNSASASSYKWEFLGGAPLTNYVAAPGSTTSATYVDLASVGPSITIPLAGEYTFEASGLLYVIDDGIGSFEQYASLKIGSAATSDNDRMLHVGCQTTGGGNANGSTAGGALLRTVSAASTVCKLQYRITVADDLNAAYMNLAAWPVRVG